MELYFTEEEKGKKALLFLHGWGCNSSIFDNVIKNVKAHCFAVDLCGFGKSQPPCEAGYSVEEYAETVKQFIEQRNLDKVTIVAHSFGARIALVLCAKYPHIVENLIITGGAGLRRFSLKRSIKIACYKFKKFLVKIHCLPQSAIKNKGSQDYKNISSVAMRNTFMKVIRQDLSEFARSVSCPTLLVWGRSDKDTPLWIAKKLNKLIKDSELIYLSGGHFAFLQHSLQFANIINAMIKE